MVEILRVGSVKEVKRKSLGGERKRELGKKSKNREIRGNQGIGVT